VALGYAMIADRDEMVTVVLNLDFGGCCSKPMSALIIPVKLKSVPYPTQIVNHPQFDARASGIRSVLFMAVKTDNLPAFQALLPFGDMAMCNRRSETLFVCACMQNAAHVLAHIAELPGFAPTQRELAQGLGFNICANRQRVLSILMRYGPNAKELFGVSLMFVAARSRDNGAVLRLMGITKSISMPAGEFRAILE
jgi:hypothetical protein